MHEMQNRMKIVFCVKPPIPSILLADLGSLSWPSAGTANSIKSFNNPWPFNAPRGNAPSRDSDYPLTTLFVFIIGNLVPALGNVQETVLGDPLEEALFETQEASLLAW